jgi:DNA-binding PadR family transcriptional regulator
MENVVLGLLILQSLTIYELNQAFKQGISMFYSASYGSLQIAVKSLIQKGMIVFDERVENGRNKKVYSITDIGRQAFYSWMVAEVPVSKLEITALSKVYFLGLIENRTEKKLILEEIVRKIEEMQVKLDAMNDALSQVKVPAHYEDVFKYQLRTLDYGRQAHIYARSWFLSLLKELDAMELKS